MTEESNGEGTFEFVDKKQDDLYISKETPKIDPLNNLSSSSPLSNSFGVSTSSGSLVSNIAPPSALPIFLTNSSTTSSLPSNTNQENSTVKSPKTDKVEDKNKISEEDVGESSTSSKHTIKIPLSGEDTPDPGVLGAGLFTWVKETVANSQVLSKVAEKAKNSVNSMITTLDPQMREFIYSGGDVEIFVASDKDIEISSIREAFQTVFGKATVTGKAVELKNMAIQPVGFVASLKSAEERINLIHQSVREDACIVAIENCLLKVDSNKWYDLDVILLKDPKNDVSLHTFTQMTPVPSQFVALAEQNTPDDYPLKSSGFPMTIGSLMANSLQVSQNEWHNALTGVSRREIILLAAKSLAGIYKNTINPI